MTLILQVDNANNIGILVKFEFFLCNRRLHWILSSENVVEFLKLHYLLKPVQSSRQRFDLRYGSWSRA